MYVYINRWAYFYNIWLSLTDLNGRISSPISALDSLFNFIMYTVGFAALCISWLMKLIDQLTNNTVSIPTLFQTILTLVNYIYNQ